MAWARPGFVPRRVLAPLPTADMEALVVITRDGSVVVHAPDDALAGDTASQPFGERGARRLVVDDRELLVANLGRRAVIVDLTGVTPFAVPAPLTHDAETARRIDLGHRYVAHGRLRPGSELLRFSAGADPVADELAALVSERLEGRAALDTADALPVLTLAVRSADPLLQRWAIAPHSSITVASRRDADRG
jgi:hypothetical protein